MGGIIVIIVWGEFAGLIGGLYNAGSRLYYS
jgi:hypothetical protein